MKRRIITSLALCFVLIMSTFSFLGCTRASTDYYTLSDDGTYYSFTGSAEFAETEYTILSEIKGIPVTEIGQAALSQNTTITKITIPDSVTKMRNNAFSKCGELAEVSIGAGITTLPDSAFAGCSKLTTVTFSEGLEKISRSAFANCIKLDNISFPSTLTTLGEKVFYRCRGLSTITLPENLTKIENSCFEDCSGLTEITINKKLDTISNNCFKNCSRVTKINFATDGVLEVINNSAFFNLSSLEEVTFPDSLKGIKASAFFNCKALRKVTFGKGIEYIGGSVSETAGGAFAEIVAEEDKPTDKAHILEMIFPEEAIGYGWYPTLDPYGPICNRCYGAEGLDDLYFLTPEEIRNNEARQQLCQNMTGYSWFKCKTPNPDRAV
ncbi:MAG: leucine-rich repeat protein [Clostridia bacterium]|nr:leucine-rich repeat protein [Clostridia bacterium]